MNTSLATNSTHTRASRFVAAPYGCTTTLINAGTMTVVKTDYGVLLGGSVISTR